MQVRAKLEKAEQAERDVTRALWALTHCGGATSSQGAEATPKAEEEEQQVEEGVAVKKEEVEEEGGGQEGGGRGGRCFRGGGR